MSAPSRRPTVIVALEALVSMMNIAVMAEAIAVEIGLMEVVTMKGSRWVQRGVCLSLFVGSWTVVSVCKLRLVKCC